MYKISLKEDKPDITYMKSTMEKLMARGIKIRDCSNILNHYDKMTAVIKDEIVNKYGIMNPNSSKQVIEFIKDLSSKVANNTRNDIIECCYDEVSKKWTSGSDALNELQDLGYEFAKDIIEYRHVAKYASTLRSIVNAADSENILRPTVSLGKTNRIQYSNPGILTIPKELLWDVIAPYSDKNTLFSVDIKNQEPHILINAVNAESLKPALEDSRGLYEALFDECFKPKVVANVLIGELDESRRYSVSELENYPIISPDKYMAVRPKTKHIKYNDETVTWIETICINVVNKGEEPELPSKVNIETDKGNVYSLDVEWDLPKSFSKVNDYQILGDIKGLAVEISKEERKEFKTVWNAISYGGQYQGISKYCKHIDAKTAYNFIANNAGLKAYRSNIDKLVRSGGTKTKTIFGTIVEAGYFSSRSQLKRILLDLPIQGSGADILSLLLKRVEAYCKEHGLEDFISVYFTRHDEIILEVSKEWIGVIGEEKVLDILHDMLEHQIDDWAPFMIEVKEVKPSELT